MVTSIWRRSRAVQAGGVDIARAQGTPLQVAELVEDDERVMAGAAKVAFVGAALLLAIGGAETRIDVEHHRLHRAAGMHGIDPAPGQVR